MNLKGNGVKQNGVNKREKINEVKLKKGIDFCFIR